MKKWMWYALGTILVVGVIGGFFINHEIDASTYNNSIKNGRTEINNKQYNEAQADFQKAAKIKPDSMEANNLLSQTSKFVDGENKFKDYDMGEASSDFNDVLKYDQGSSVLKNRAKVELKVLKQVSKNVDRLEKIYSQALEQNKAKEFTASNTTLDGIFDDDLASNSFYAGIVKEAKKLKSANDNQVVLSKFKAKKHSSADDKTSDKKTNKITKASKENSSAIDAVNNSVSSSVSNNDTTPSNDNSSYNPDNQSSNNLSASDNKTSNPAPDNNSNNSQSNTPAPAEKHDSDSNNNNNDSGSTPTSKPDDGGSGSHSNEPATPPADSKGNDPTNGTPSN